ncbi:MAG: YabP/YqfC family sporulation protein [Clostridia bacterium]|nr:YabP/YqfC family sporulation protein [Clostridia bacterium]
MLKKVKKTAEFLSSLPPFSFHTEIDRVSGGMSVCVSGVRTISDFSDECAALRLPGVTMKISGTALSITVYENSTAEIVGKVSGVEFVYDKA